MNDPLKNLSSMQMAMVEAWANSTRHMLDAWRHMIELQQRFLRHPDYHRTHVEIDRGPSFTEKYGRRAHDIDPERDV